MDLSLGNYKLDSPAKRAALILGVCILLNAAFVYFMVLPLNGKISSTRKSTEDIMANNDRIQKIIGTTNTKKENTYNLKNEHEKLVKTGVITPLLNSYAMRAKTLLTPYTRKCGLTIEDVTELAPIPLLQPEHLNEICFSRQPIEISTSGSYTQLTAFVSYVEKELPMATLSSLKITTQNRDPEIHKINICFEWPAQTEITSQ